MLPRADNIAKPSEGNAIATIRSVVPSGPSTYDNPSNAIPIAFAPPLLSAPAGTNTVAARAPPSGMHIVQVDQTSSPPVAHGAGIAVTRKRINETVVQTGSFKRRITYNLSGSNSVDSSHQVSLCYRVSGFSASVDDILTEMFSTYNSTYLINLACVNIDATGLIFYGEYELFI